VVLPWFKLAMMCAGFVVYIGWLPAVEMEDGWEGGGVEDWSLGLRVLL
jgi:hypothetical protein